jgi:hypothetical protein
MGGTEPGEQGPDQRSRPGRRLEHAPGERYAGGAERRSDATETGHASSALLGPALKAAVVAAVGAALLFALGALLSETAGLLAVAGLTGAAVGLLLARAAAPGRGEEPALTRRRATWLAIATVWAAVAVAALGTWLHALGEGGTLGLVDYLLDTFGLLVPAELAIGALAAAWGVGAGPVQR